MPFPGFGIGHDNVEELEFLNEVDPTCLFVQYSYIQQEWSGWEDSEADGDRMKKKIGLPSTKLIFPLATLEEWMYFYVTLCGSNLGAKVTAFLHDQDIDAWGWYNGRLDLSEIEARSREDEEFKPLEIPVRDLVLIAYA